MKPRGRSEQAANRDAPPKSPRSKNHRHSKSNASRPSIWKPSTTGWIILGSGLVLLLSIGWAFYSARSKPVLSRAAHYVGRHTCIECHQQQHDLFLQSHHHQAMAVASPETVLANFDNQALEHDGLTSRFFRDGHKFMVRTEGADGAMTDFEVRFVLAYHPLQQYMVQIVKDLPPTKNPDDAGSRLDPASLSGLPGLQVLRLCWDVVEQRWFYLRPEDVPEKLAPDDPLHWTGVTQRWNTSCAACHSTNLQKNFDPHLAGFRTTFSEIDVSCEACHGPGSHHVELAQQRWFSWDADTGSGLVSLKNATAQQQVALCASCHSRRRLLSEDFHETRVLGDHLLYEPMREDTYFVDGQIKDEVFEFGSYIQSKMYSKGIRCTDCHDAHSGKTYFPDNRLCTSCHQHPAGVYDSPQHHGHLNNGPGSRCVDCHMPDRHYMDVDPRRDHSLRIPRPDLSLKLGVPNACTGCHLDHKKVPSELHDNLVRYQDWQKIAAEGQAEVRAEIERVDRWAAETVETWRSRQGKSPHAATFGEWLHQIRQLDPVSIRSGSEPATVELRKIARDGLASPMYRVTALSEMANWSDDRSLEDAFALMSDSDPHVVFHAMQRLEREMGRWQEYIAYGAPAIQCQAHLRRIAESLIQQLSHPARLVRTQAATMLLSLPATWRQAWLGSQQRRFDVAIQEALAVHLLNEELAAAADISQMLGQQQQALDYYRLAIQHQPTVYGIRTNLALLLEQRASDNAATMTEIQGLRDHDHQLLEQELQRSGGLDSAGALHYRFAMSKYLQGDMVLVEKHLLEALQRQPHEATFLLAAATYYKAVYQWQNAAAYGQKLLRQDPHHPGYQALWREIQQQLAQGVSHVHDGEQ